MNQDRAALGLLAAALVLAGLRFATVGAAGADETTLVHDGLRLLRGEAMYRDFFQFVPPLTAWLAALGQAAMGPGVWGPRLLQEALLVASGLATYGLARRLGCGPGLALVPAAVPLLALHRFLPTFNQHWPAVALGAAALAMGARALQSGGGRAWAGSGALVGLAGLASQSDGLVLACALAGGLLLDAWRGEAGLAAARARAGAYFAGLGGVLAAAAVPLAASGALGAALWDIWVWPFLRYRTPGGINDIAFATDLHVNLSPFVRFWNLPAFYAQVAHFALLYAFMAGAAALALAWLAGLPGRPRGAWTPRDAAFAPVGLAAIGLLLVAMRGRADVIHVAAYAWPGVLVAATAAAALARRLPEPAFDLARALPGGAVAAFLAGGLVLWAGDMRREPASWAGFGRPDGAIAQASPALAWLRDRAAPGDALMAFPFAGYWGLYGPRAVGYWTVMLPPGTGYITEGEYAAFLASIQASRPRFVVWAPVGKLAAERISYGLTAGLPGYRLAATREHPLYGASHPAEIYERIDPR